MGSQLTVDSGGSCADIIVGRNNLWVNIPSSH